MIFNDELIIKLKMKVYILPLLLFLIVKVYAHKEYDESDPFNKYKQ